MRAELGSRPQAGPVHERGGPCFRRKKAGACMLLQCAAGVAGTRGSSHLRASVFFVNEEEGQL